MAQVRGAIQVFFTTLLVTFKAGEEDPSLLLTIIKSLKPVTWVITSHQAVS